MSHDLVPPARFRGILHDQHMGELLAVYHFEAVRCPPCRAAQLHHGVHGWVDPGGLARNVADWKAADSCIFSVLGGQGLLPASGHSPLSGDLCLQLRCQRPIAASNFRSVRTRCCLATSRVCFSVSQPVAMASKARILPPLRRRRAVRTALLQPDCGLARRQAARGGNRFGQFFRGAPKDSAQIALAVAAREARPSEPIVA